ncbi:protein kinase [Paenibacillus sp. LHD-117]|uniref:protein kinase domain-containing protein n=1 Tax=Paenibacillus sp. LHD-117 TaxID=3071412 RepID=UPI0027E0FD2A|nr:protein kinase [Paenibacillus sp. LHD-117]MDQ6418086.1 protein kinase [Paenibacillus sp. LHD-117]
MKETDVLAPANGMPPIGEVFGGRYLVNRIVGQGGMGVVYAVEDTKLAGRLRAMKVTRTPSGAGAYSSEASTLMLLDHPNLPQITDYYPPEQQNGLEALVMEYIEGYTLSDWLLGGSGSMPFHELLRIGRQLCSALRYLHEQPAPIIHRDLKPSNIMIDRSGAVKLIDFGISRHYKEGQRGDTVQLGTVGFAAPERHFGGQSDARTDIYGLGAVLYCLAAGDVSILSRLGTARGKLNANELDSSIPRPFLGLLECMLESDPERRFQTMKEVELALKPFMERLPGPDRTEENKKWETRMMTERKQVTVIGLSSGAGATFLAITLAVLLARRGLAVTAAEYGALASEWTELLPPSFMQTKKSRSQPVRWIPVDTSFASDRETRLRTFERALRGCVNEYQIVDMSGGWDRPEAAHFIKQSAHVIVVADPNVYKWQIERIERLAELQGDRQLPNQQWHWVANKNARFGENKQWLSMFPGKACAIVPLLPQEKIWNVIWSGKWPTDYALLDQKLARALQPVCELIDSRPRSGGR